MRSRYDRTEQHWYEPSQVRPGGAVVLSDSEASVLLLFTAEAKAAAISCINLLCCYNVVANAATGRLPWIITQFVPNEPSSTDDLFTGRLAVLFKPATRSGQRGFGRFLAHSRDEIERLIELQESAGHLTKADIARGSDVASTAACFAKITVKDLVAIHRRLFREFDVAELSYLSSLLDDVLQGHSPLIVDGRLMPVKTDFEIRDIRVDLVAEAIIANTRSVERVLVRNISQSGLGLDGAQQLKPSELVEIRLSHSSRRLAGRVVWKVGNKAGVEFIERLDDKDTLLNP